MYKIITLNIKLKTKLRLNYIINNINKYLN